MADSEQPTTPPAAPKAPETLGQMLRNARVAQDLTIEQLSTELRIEAKQLTALELNRFEQIGVPVFVKGYLKQYGLRLGLDVNDLLALYYKQTTLADIEIQPSRTITLRDERQIASWVLAGVVLLVVVGGLAYWWWTGGSFGAASSTTPSSPASATPEDAALPEPPPAEEVAPRRDDPLPQPERALPVVDQPATEPGGQEAPLEAVAASVASDDGDEATAAGALTIPLELTFDQDSWVEITDARGERLLFGLSSAGRNVTVRGAPPFAVVLGNADSVRLTVDGAPYAIPTTGRQGNLARFDVDVVEE